MCAALFAGALILSSKPGAICSAGVTPERAPAAPSPPLSRSAGASVPNERVALRIRFSIFVSGGPAGATNARL